MLQHVVKPKDNAYGIEKVLKTTARKTATKRGSILLPQILFFCCDC